MVDAYPVLRRDYPLNEKNLDWWVNEQDSPYTEIQRFDWYRGYHLGGRSLTWGRQSYRLSDLDFEANAKEGIAIDWPVRYADIAPWYDHVEKHAGISGSIEGLPQLPDGQFQPPMPLNCAEEIVAGRVAKRFENRRIIPGRVANLTQPLPGRGRCQYRNACALGCPSGSYFSTQASTLPFAQATGRLTLKTEAIVTDVVYDADRKRATGVRVMDALTNATTEYRSKVVFLCASTLNSTWLLMRSATDVWPGGLGSSSGELGHNLMDHHFRCGASGISEDAERSRRLRPAAERLLHSALQEPVRRQARLPARLRLPGLGQPPGMAARDRGAGRRRGVQGRGRDAGAVADRRRRVRRDAAESRQPHHARSGEEGQVGTAGPGDRLRDRRERAPDAEGHDERHGRDARRGRRQERARQRQRLLPRRWASTKWAPRAWDAIRRPRC